MFNKLDYPPVKHPLIPGPEKTGTIMIDNHMPDVIVMYWEGGPIVFVADEAVSFPFVVTTVKGYQLGPWYLEYIYRDAKGWFCINWGWEVKMPILSYTWATGEFTY